MKLLTSILLMTLTLPAHAETFFYSRTTVGGAVVLSVNKGNCLYGRHGVLVNMHSQPVMSLCWELQGDNIRATFSDGDVMTYPIGQFLKADSDDDSVSI